MTFNEYLQEILNRIEKGHEMDEDLRILLQKFQAEDRQLTSQLGKYNVNIGEGKEIHIGDRIYKQWDEEATKALVKAIQQASGIHQNTHSGDVAGRDIDSRNI
ncbi:MAG: hypothetical protein ACRCU2_06530, partial [Planktothrix sp.]